MATHPQILSSNTDFCHGQWQPKHRKAPVTKCAPNFETTLGLKQYVPRKFRVPQKVLVQSDNTMRTAAIVGYIVIDEAS